MPFTLSHPAAAVPFTKKGFVFSALVIGSMAPDFELFLPGLIQDRFAHSVPGIFLFCLPASCVVFCLFHLVLKEPLLSLLPDSHQKRLQPIVNCFTFGTPKRWALIFLSFFIGILTHIVWDSFTHETGWFVEYFPAMRNPVFHIGPSAIPLFFFLQYSSTIIGLGLLYYWYDRWYQQTTPEKGFSPMHFSQKSRGFILLAILGGAILTAGVFSFDILSDEVFPLSLREIAYVFRNIVFVVFATMVIEIGIYCLVWLIIHHQKVSAKTP